MRKNINIEVEGQELILKNKAGDYVIIPKKYRTKVQGMIKDNCHGCIDSLVETLPAMSDYAQDGTVFPSDDPITLIKPSGERVNTTTGSEFYRTHYNSKLIGKQNEDKSWNLIDEIYRGSDLPEVVISSKIIPNTLGDYSNQFSKQNPQDKFFANKQAAHNKEFYSAPLWAQQAVGGYNDKRKANDKKSDEEEYNQQRNDFIAEKLLKRTPFEGINNRINWMNKFTPQELETIKKSKYSSELEEGALQKFENFILGMNTSGIKFKSEGTTAEEAEADQANPLNILQPLSIPTKVVQSAYKKNYSFSDAMKGKANNASIVEDIITDPLNFAGAGLVGKLSKADKVINATKVGSKVLNKLDDAVNNINRIKFDDFKNDNEFFRVIVGDEAFDDIVQTQKIRTKQPSSVKNTPPNTINLDRRGSTAFPSFSKGSPSLSYANDNPNHYIIRTADESIKPSTSGRHGKGTTMFPTDKSGKHLTELDASKVQVYKHVGNGEYELVNTAKPIISSVDDVGEQAYKQWQLEELPGLHLKSTMEGQAISKIIEPKTGLINIEQALGIIGKESGGANKVSLIRQGLGENIPKKMDFNEFRKVIQDQLIPLEKQFATHSSGYGIDRLGYGKYKTIINERGNPILQPLKGKNLEPLENQTLILGNKGKFGRGSSAHGNPEETLGHIHFLRDAETPDVLTVTQIQSDAFQGTHRIMPKNTSNATALERQKKSLQRMEELQERNKSVLNKMKTEGVDEAGLPVQKYQIKQFEDIVKAQEQSNLFKKADIENFTQKQLLDKNHQERYLQELVDYAGKRGDINKVRVPTSETAAKVQGYSKNTATGMDEMGLPTELGYSKEHQTILKKYSEQPKTIKKLFGVEPNLVTDSKGNTWYEFDIPKKFKEGKGEIKAFQVIPPAIGSALYLQSQNKNKSEQ